jgi:hypothetical protein
MDACQAEEVAGAHACRVVVARALRRRPPTNVCGTPETIRKYSKPDRFA